jgi:hypothetical protein
MRFWSSSTTYLAMGETYNGSALLGKNVMKRSVICES